jgi:DNA transformation protein and related proteins|uniref:TfoX/Sxy family protein n=1 Tax=Halomonas sp. TaxID=1486246 RepID=UPI00262CC34A|nr:TfoX/Sxy family protein [Halomonas sp.]
MSVSHELLDFLLDQLAPLGNVSARRMFGSMGVFLDGRMFGILSRENRFYIKADAGSLEKFVEQGCEPFSYWVSQPSGERKQKRLSYYEVPDSALEDQDELMFWARLGISASTPSG